MEFQAKPAGFNGVEGAGVANPGYSTTPTATTARAPSASGSNATMTLGYIFRSVAIVLTFLSTVVMGAAREKVTLINTDPSTGDYASGYIYVKSGYSAAFVYFVVVNAIVFLYSVISLAISIAKRSSLSSLQLPFTIVDLLMAVLLFSCNSAAASIAIVAKNGQDRLGWGSICNIVSNFCGRITASIVLAMFAAGLYLSLVLLGIMGLQKRAR